jgi:hypothetical protein
MEKKNHATVYLPKFFSTRQTLLIWRVTLDLRVGHSIYELTFHPRNAGAALFAVSGGDALRASPLVHGELDAPSGAVQGPRRLQAQSNFFSPP